VSYWDPPPYIDEIMRLQALMGKDDATSVNGAEVSERDESITGSRFEKS
jgi:hypothetical protein